MSGGGHQLCGPSAVLGAADVGDLGASPPALSGTHTAIGIYEPCRCDVAETDYRETHFPVDWVGLTCERGLLFVVCSLCCTGADAERRCSQHHRHGSGLPHCPRALGPDSATTRNRRDSL